MACDSPISIKCKGQDILVPCNRCPPCIARRVNEWVYRIMWEEQNNSVSSHFVTLTYSTESVPLSPHGFMTLRKSDFQKFMKRLRKNTGIDNIKYYACGEYGGQTNRPHYHAIILNVPDAQAYADAWTIDGKSLGGVMVGSVTGDSVAYTMKYIEKDSFAQKRKRWRHVRDDREFEFALMSKGLGKGYVNDETRSYHSADLTRNYLVKQGGYKVALPRYYRKLIYDESQLDAQRDIICREVAKQQEKDVKLFVSSDRFRTYADMKQADINGRLRKFHLRREKRNKI